MKTILFLAVIVTSLVYLVPIMKAEQANQIQAQEESPVETFNYGPETYKIVYKTEKPSENEIADILWMKKAAEISIQEGIPYFNVLDQKIYPTFSEAFGEDLMTVEGIIQLDHESMEAEYDAREITSLVLPEIAE